MKRLMCIVIMVFVCCLLSIHAQQYVNVKQVCPQCQGYGMITSYYGPIYCPTCGGGGTVIVTVPNPQYSNEVSFHGAHNNGTYSRTSSVVNVYTESGHFKGSYSIYLHYGKRYISFNNTWICIQGKSRFGFNGNWYVIKY